MAKGRKRFEEDLLPVGAVDGEYSFEQYAPLPPQLAFYKSNAKFRCFYGGYGSGKTQTLCFEAFIAAITHPGSVGLIGRMYYTDLADTTQATFLSLIPRKIVLSWHRSNNELIIAAQGGRPARILFRHLDEPDRLKSLNLDWFAIDEADEEPEEAFLVLIGRLRGKAGPLRGWLATNPNGHDWIWQRFIDPTNIHAAQLRYPRQANDTAPPVRLGSLAASYFTVISSSTLNTHLPPDYLSTMLKDFSPEWVERYIYANSDELAGLVFPHYSEAVHVVKLDNAPKLDNTLVPWRWFVSADHGFDHPTCVLWGAVVDKQGTLYIADEYSASGKTVPEHVEAIKLITDRLGISMDYAYWVGDTSARSRHTYGTEVHSVWDEYTRHGIYWQLAHKDRMASMLRISSLLKLRADKTPGILINERCVNLRRQLASATFARKRLGMPGKKDDIERAPGKDDALDAFRYLVMAATDERLGGVGKPPPGYLTWGWLRKQSSEEERRLWLANPSNRVLS